MVFSKIKISQIKAINTGLKKEINVFISYAWESGAAKEFLDQRLKRLQKTLIDAGASNVFLDLNLMDGDLIDRMKRELEKSSVVLVAATDLYATKAADAVTRRQLQAEGKLPNVAFEYMTALERQAQQRLFHYGFKAVNQRMPFPKNCEE